jgi:hypothetical protein
MLGTQATKKGPLCCATAHLSSFLALSAVEIAVAQRSGTDGMITLQGQCAVLRAAQLTLVGRLAQGSVGAHCY